METMEGMMMLAARCLKLAGVYLIAGLALGLAMTMTKRFTLSTLHAHMNLLGWVTLALAAIVFAVWPRTESTRLARAFFWIYNLSLPVMLITLALVLIGGGKFVLAMKISSAGVLVGAILFVVNLFVAIPPAARSARKLAPDDSDADRRRPRLED
jgi:hypothetical protein